MGKIKDVYEHISHFINGTLKSYEFLIYDSFAHEIFCSPGKRFNWVKDEVRVILCDETYKVDRSHKTLNDVWGELKCPGYKQGGKLIKNKRIKEGERKYCFIGDNLHWDSLGDVIPRYAIMYSPTYDNILISYLDTKILQMCNLKLIWPKCIIQYTW